MGNDATDSMIARYAWDPFRLWEVRAEYPAHDRAEVAASIERLLRNQMLVCYATDDEAGPTLSMEDALRYIADETQWQDMVENPWPKRGRIYEFLLTEKGRSWLTAS
jgi:hypothetical protein